MTTRTGGRAHTTTLQRWAGRLAFLARAERGNAAIEFALATPILVALLVPVADLGMAFSQQIQVQQAAQAGAQYASMHPWANGSATAISNAVTSATNISTLAASPAPNQFCGCPTGSAIATAASCTSTCSDGQPAGYYVVVNAQAPYAPQLPYSILGSVTLAAQSTVRVR